MDIKPFIEGLSLMSQELLLVLASTFQPLEYVKTLVKK